jgi:hypothetical protein
MREIELNTSEFKTLLEGIYLTEERKILNEYGWWNTVGDVLGIFDPTGVVDLVNGLDYIRQGDYFFGLLSMISVIPYVGDAVAKPIIGVGKTSKLFKGIDGALLLAKNGDTLNAGIKLEQLSKNSGLIAKLVDSVPKWATKLKDAINALPGKKITGGLRRVIIDWIDLFISVAKKRKAAKVTVGKFADKVAFADKKTAVEMINQLKKTITADSKVFKNFKPENPSFLAKYFWPGISFNVLGRNRGLTSLMRRTKWYAGLLDYMGFGNFVGPEELMNNVDENELNTKFQEYVKTPEAQKIWKEEFGNQSEIPKQEKQGDTETSTQNNSDDIIGKIITDIFF